VNQDSNRSAATLADFQRLIRDMYLEKDVARGIDGTFMWLMEEVGELASALRNGTHEERLGEFADVLAWLATIANVAGVDLAEAVTRKYGSGCPGCGQWVCTCADAEKP
jgi:NTP pyrophosphatase (non-canonical NTP hydrolase)